MIFHYDVEVGWWVESQPPYDPEYRLAPYTGNFYDPLFTSYLALIRDREIIRSGHFRDLITDPRDQGILVQPRTKEP